MRLITGKEEGKSLSKNNKKKAHNIITHNIGLTRRFGKIIELESLILRYKYSLQKLNKLSFSMGNNSMIKEHGSNYKKKVSNALSKTKTEIKEIKEMKSQFDDIDVDVYTISIPPVDIYIEVI